MILTTFAVQSIGIVLGGIAPMARISHNAACHLCNSREELQSHHIDWDHSNNSSSNIIILCQRCHVHAHKAGFMSRSEFESVRLRAKLRDPNRFDEEVSADSNGQWDLFS